MKQEIVAYLAKHGPSVVQDIAYSIGCNSKQVCGHLRASSMRDIVVATGEMVPRLTPSGWKYEAPIFALRPKSKPRQRPRSPEELREERLSALVAKLKKRGGGPFGHLVAQMI